VLSREGVKSDRDEPQRFDRARSVWRLQTTTLEGARFEIRCTGPDLPETIPAAIVRPADVARDPDWHWTHRLVVAPPLITLDLCWGPEGSLRVLVFSRGDWEKRLLEMAQPYR
jgi:hypothetical protein